MSMSGGGGGGGRRDARMDSTLLTNGTGDPEDKEDDDADNATNGEHASAGSANNVLQTIPNGITRHNPTLFNFLVRGRTPARFDTVERAFQHENAYIGFDASPSMPRGSIHETPVSPTSGQHPPGLTDRRGPGLGYGVVPGTDVPRGGPVAQHQPDDYIRDLDQRQASMIWLTNSNYEGSLLDDPWNESRASTPIEHNLSIYDLQAEGDIIAAKAAAYDEHDRTMAQVSQFAATLPSGLSERVMARFMEHCQSTDTQTAAVAAFVQLVPFLFWMARSMAAFPLQDQAVMNYAQGTRLLPQPGPAPMPTVLEKSELWSDTETMPLSSPVSEVAVQDQDGSAGEAEVVPSSSPAPELAPGSDVQDQAQLRREFEAMHSSSSASEADTQDQAGPVRESDAMPSSGAAPELAPGSDVKDQTDNVREAEAVPVSCPAPEAATQDQAGSTSGLEVDSAALNAARVEAEPMSGLAAMNEEAFGAAQILASMQMEDILFDRPPSPSDEQPPAVFPKASGQFNQLPPPSVDRPGPSPDRQSSKIRTNVPFPDQISAHELENLRARRRAPSAPELELSTIPSDHMAHSNRVFGLQTDEARNFLEGPSSDARRTRVSGQTRSCRNPASWSPRGKQIFDDWIDEEVAWAARRQMQEDLWQIRHKLFLQSFYDLPSDDESEYEEEHPRRNSEPVGEFPPVNLEALDAFYKMNQRWKAFHGSAEKHLDNVKALGPSAFETLDPRLKRIAELEESNGNLRRALASGDLSFFGRQGPPTDNKVSAAAHQEHGDDSSQSLEVEAQPRKKKHKRGKRKAPLKTKKELAEEVQQRIATQGQNEQQGSESASPTPARDLPPASPEVPVETPAQPDSHAVEQQASSSIVPQVAEPAVTEDDIAAAAAQAEKAKAKEKEKAKKKAKAKAHRENKHAKKREAEDRKAALELARQVAERLDLEEKASQELERQKWEAEERKAAMELAQREAERLDLEEKANQELERQKREARDREAAMELTRQEAEKASQELQRRKREAKDRKAARKLARKEAERSDLEERANQGLQRRERSASKNVQRHSDAQANHDVQRDSEASQGEQVTVPICQLPAPDTQIQQSPDVLVLSRRDSDAQPLRVPQHATFLIPSETSPRLPFQLSGSSGPSESSLTDFTEERRDQNVVIQQIGTLRQQRIEFGVDGSSSVTILPTRRISALEREEPSEVTYPEPRQLDSQKEPTIVAEAPVQHQINVQQHGDAVPPQQPRRVVFQLGGETSEGDTDTTAEQQLSLNEVVALRDSARRISLNLGEIDVPTESLGNSSMTSDVPPSPVSRSSPGQMVSRRAGAVRTRYSGPRRISMPNTISNERTQRPRFGNQVPPSHMQQPIPNGYPAQHNPLGYQIRNWNPNPTAGLFFPGPNAYFNPCPYVAPPWFMQPQDDLPCIVDGRTPEQRHRRLLPNLRAPYPQAVPYAAPTALMQPQDDLPCIVDGRTPEQRRRSPLPDIRAPLPPRNQARNISSTQERALPRNNDRYLPSGRPGVEREYCGYGIRTQSITMPSSMTPAVTPPPTTRRGSRPTEHRLSLDPSQDLGGGDEQAIASSSCSDIKEEVDEADDESSGKDP